MQIIVTGRHVELTQPIEQYAIRRCDHLEKFRDHVQSIEIVLDKVHLDFEVEAKIELVSVGAERWIIWRPTKLGWLQLPSGVPVATGSLTFIGSYVCGGICMLVGLIGCCTSSSQPSPRELQDGFELSLASHDPRP